MLKYIIKTFLLLLITTQLSFAKKVTLQLSWFDQFQFAGYYIAKEKGFYSDVGLDVTIAPFEFGLDIPQGVSDGKYDFAVGRETLILEKAANKRVVSLYALFQASPLILISTKESGINNIADFSNKRIMTTIDDASEVSIKAMFNSKNIDIKDLNFIKHTHNINDLIEKKTDVISAYTSKSPYHLQKMKVAYNIFAPKDYGFDMYSDLLFTSESKVANELDTVLKFKKASLKGWEYAYANIEQTVDLIIDKYNTQNLTRQELLFEAQELKKLSYYKTQKLGDIDLAKLQRIYDLYNVMGLVENKIDIEDFVLADDGFVSFAKKVWTKLSQYRQMPYIYFFISLFFAMIIAFIFYIIIKNKQKQKLINKIEEKNHRMTDYINQIDKYVISSSTDTKGIITDVSQAFCRINGYKKNQLIGKKHKILRHRDMPKKLYEDLWRTISSGVTWKGEIKNRAKNKAIYWIDIVIEPEFDKNKNIIGYSAVAFDITAKKIIETASITDGLTNIFNRRYFNDIFPKMINEAKRNDELLCFLMIDIDHFKQYNDNYGHQAGDDVLIRLSKCLKATLKRAGDMAFRLGGEEFGILYKSETPQKALEFANTLKQNIRDLKMIHEYSTAGKFISVSMGLVSQKGSQLEDMETIYKKADSLLYKSKESGRNKVSVNTTR